MSCAATAGLRCDTVTDLASPPFPAERTAGWDPDLFAYKMYRLAMRLDRLAGPASAAWPFSTRELAYELTRCACAGCGARRTEVHLQACGLCRCRWFCGTACQAADWKAGHRRACPRDRPSAFWEVSDPAHLKAVEDIFK